MRTSGSQKVTPYERRRMVLWYKGGVSRKEIASRTGRHYYTVWRIIKEELIKENGGKDNGNGTV